MSLVVNNNMMAANTARNLNAHYGRLATSTQRLSSGLRVNSAADDAAGLAIRELQRADIAALHQGARNANDAISMIQVADGSLGIIDEKLIRMKELAEQAATGTYDSTQRLMIESEYQAMASEITRIANATDFNGMKLLDGTLAGDHDGSGLVSEGKMKIHFGTGNDSAEDYYYVEIGEVTAQALGLGNASTWKDVQNRALNSFEDSLRQQIKNSSLDGAAKGQLLAQLDKDANGDYVDGPMKELKSVLDDATDYTKAWQYWDNDDQKFWTGNSDLMERYLTAADTTTLDQDTLNAKAIEIAQKNAYEAAYKTSLDAATDPTDPTAIQAAETAGKTAADAIKTINDVPAKDKTDATDALQKQNLTDFWNGLRTTEQEKLQYAWGQAAISDLANAITTKPNGKVSEKNLLGNDSTKWIEDLQKAFTDDKGTTDTTDDINMIDVALKDMEKKVGHMDFAGHTIETQEDAQMALDAINDAIVSKDKIRAHLGAAQNRLENTVSNLNIQAENLQAAESRISDVDVATEMTQFVRNQILTQSAVAMLSQANSLPQMAMQLIGG